MLVFMALNTIYGFSAINRNLPTFFTLSFFTLFGSVAFLFVYPFQMARTDYRNKVMSLLIASGVSRVHYYFVKVGATLIFSVLSFFVMVFMPFAIIAVFTDITAIVQLLALPFRIDAAAFFLTFMNFLSLFFMLMTAVIIARGRVFTIFVFFGLSFVTSLLASSIREIFGVPRGAVATVGRAFGFESLGPAFIQYAITIVVMGIIGILVLRKQDL
jgi:hypothetical protein